MTDQTPLEHATDIAATLNEDDAMALLVKLEERHNWIGVTFTATDVSQFIMSRREAVHLDPLSETELRNAAQQIVESKEWTIALPDWLNEQGVEALGDLLQKFDR